MPEREVAVGRATDALEGRATGPGSATPPLADSPLGRTIATTPTDIWNDSCSVPELEYAISFGAVGATARADELAPEEFREGGARLARLVAEVHPRVLAVARVSAYRVAFARPAARRFRTQSDWP